MSQIDQMLSSYSRRRGRREELRQGAIGTLIDVFMFRRMITPWLIRMGFLLFCLFAVVATSAAIVGPLLGSKPPRAGAAPINVRQTNPSMSSFMEGSTSGAPGSMFPLNSPLARTAWELAALVFGVCMVRVLCEGMIVIFQINETLTDVHKRLGDGVAGSA